MKATQRKQRPQNDQPLRTKEEARQWLRDHGVSVAAFAREHNVSRNAVNDALRGVGKGGSGQSHQAAVALGMKRAPNSGTHPLSSGQMTPCSTSDKGKPVTKKAVRKAGRK